MSQKNQNVQILTNLDKKVRNDESIQNLVSEFKPDNIWPFLAEKKLAKYLILPFLTTCGQKWGQMLFDLNSETRFGIPSSLHSFLTPICKDLLVSNFGLSS